MSAYPNSFSGEGRMNGLEAGGHHDGAVFPLDKLVFLLVVDGARGAHLFAQAALAGLELNALRGRHRHVGNGLSKGDINGAPVVQVHVEFVLALAGGALGGAQRAARALGLVHETGLFADGGLEGAHESGNLFHLGVGDDVDLLVLRSFHHLGGENARRAVQGGEGLVQLSHAPADGGPLFHDVHLVDLRRPRPARSECPRCRRR